MRVRITLTPEQRDAIRRVSGQDVKQVTVLVQDRAPGVAPYQLEEISLPMFEV